MRTRRSRTSGWLCSADAGSCVRSLVRSFGVITACACALVVVAAAAAGQVDSGSSSAPETSPTAGGDAAEPEVSYAPDRALIEASDDWPAVVAEAQAAYEAGVRRAGEDEFAAAPLFELAAIGFRRAIEEGGLETAALRFNLANGYARLGSLGLAIEQYLIAERLNPADGSIRRNLLLVRGRVATLIEGAESGVVGEPAGGALLEPVRAAHRAVPGPVKLWIFVGSAALFWGLLGVRLWRWSRGERAWPARRVIATPFVVALLTSASVGWEAFGLEAQVAVVVGDSVHARTGPDESYGRRFTEPLTPGVELLVLERRGAWVRGRLANGRDAFVPESGVSIVGGR